MKTIFLDHYGVMILSKFDIEREIGSLPSIQEYKSMNINDEFSSECIDILNDILHKTDAEIVISSDYKNIFTIDEVQIFYNRVIKKPISYTTNLDNFESIHQNRSTEILDYISCNNITKWVCIDDLYLPDISNFVWCRNPFHGLKGEGIKEKVLEYLA